MAFLDQLIEASVNGEKLSDDEIREEVDAVMFAGHDTTATCMSWFLYCMARNPQEQVRSINIFMTNSNSVKLIFTIFQDIVF